MKLKKLLEGVTHDLIVRGEDMEITGVVYDSRKVIPGCLFVCLRGEKTDGHDFIWDAVRAGAAALVVEELPGKMADATALEYEEVVELTDEVDSVDSADAVVVRVKDSRSALAHISATWFGNPAEQMTMVGITGTKGKTTTAHMIKRILEKSGQKVGMIGTIGAFIGEKKLPVKNTTPESYELHSLFSQMREEGCSSVVMEVSSQGLKQKRTEGIHFDYAVFLNISPDHIGAGEHADFEEYLACKKLLFYQAERTVVNIDAEHWSEVISGAKDRITVSTRQSADFCGSDIENVWEPGLLGTSFLLSGRAEGRITLNMPGRFNVENALIAIAVTTCMGVDMPRITEALAEVSVKGRTQVLKEVSHFSTFLIDYAHNALSMESLLQTLKEYKPKRLICLFGGGGNKPKQRRYDMGLVAGKYADLTILTMDNPRYEEMDKINQDIICGLKVHDGKYQIIDDREEAIHYLIDHCDRDDMVALIGKGHEEYQEVKGVKYPFSEEEVVARYLETK